MNVKSNLKDLLTRDGREKRIKELAKKIKITSGEQKELEILQYAENYNMELPFGALIPKRMILKTLFQDVADFQSTSKSDKWDYMVVNMGFNKSKNLKTITEKVRPIFSFYKGEYPDLTLVDTEEILPSEGHGDGFGKTTPPPSN
ncbi:MAG: hypothetical protein IPH28_00885 [Cytophagaceae bacterium]|nr:hypothetical protein [Cytophagaceae bacterium]MBK9510856.1 hypothetical protein [Cytophagaceae bacterium]MBK9934662.1 hypothetical protein [Cytophagaceae bacterium]MBL0301099.1 hypothetical protein [Cytophagaceae bacterium]MBL0323917.1 hypothetical protein [Cytophagaceae bacterium]